MEKPFPAYRGEEPYAFVCYAHADARVVYADMQWLDQRGVRLWYDEGIAAGAVWRDEITKALRAAHHFIFFVSKASVATVHCLREVDYALDDGIPVVPVYLEDVALPDGLDLSLRRIQALHRADDAAYRTHLLEVLGGGAVGNSKETTSATVETPRASKKSQWWYALAASAAAIAIAAVAWIALRPTPHTPETSPIRSLAVLPLDNLSPEPDQFYADGMTETLIAELSKLPGLRVISRTSVMQFKGAHTALTEIAKALNVDGIIEGSVMRDAGQVRVTTQLIDARDDRHLWAEQYDREASRVFEIQSEVAKAVAGHVAIVLTPQVSQRFQPRKPIDPRAQELYFRGLAQRSQMYDLQNVNAAIESFSEALRIEPDYAQALAALATTTALLAKDETHYYRDDETSRFIAANARRAVELDDSIGEAHSVLGHALFRYDWDWPAAEREFRRGVELGDASSSEYWVLLADLRRYDEAIAMADAAVAADPSNLYLQTQRIVLNNFAARYDRTVEEAERFMKAHGDNGNLLGHLIVALAELGRFPEAIAAAERASRALSRPEVDLAAEVAKRGPAVAFWRAMADELCEKPPHVDPHGCAWALEHLGRTDEALDALEAAYREHHWLMSNIVGYSPLKPLYKEPRFIEIVRKMKLPMPPA